MDEGKAEKKRIIYSEASIRGILKNIAPDSEVFSMPWLQAYKAYDQLNALAKFEGNKIAEKKAEHKSTLWEPGNVHNTVRLLIEENKINITWKYLIEFEAHKHAPSFQERLEKSAGELNEPVETLQKIATKFEDLVGNFLEFATNHYELLQLSELNEILKYIRNMLRSAIDNPDALVATLTKNPDTRCQEVLCMRYVANIFKHAERLKQPVLEQHLTDTELFHMLLLYVQRFWPHFQPSTLLLQVSALSHLVASEAFEIHEKKIISDEKVGEVLIALAEATDLWDKAIPQEFEQKKQVRAIRELCEKKKLFSS